jgi:hypothetical protein
MYYECQACPVAEACQRGLAVEASTQYNKGLCALPGRVERHITSMIMEMRPTMDVGTAGEIKRHIPKHDQDHNEEQTPKRRSQKLCWCFIRLHVCTPVNRRANGPGGVSAGESIK